MSFLIWIFWFWLSCFLYTVAALVITEVSYMLYSMDYLLWALDRFSKDLLKDVNRNKIKVVFDYTKSLFVSFLFWPKIVYFMYKAFTSGRTVGFYIYEILDAKNKENEEVEKRFLEEKHL